MRSANRPGEDKDHNSMAHPHECATDTPIRGSGLLVRRFIRDFSATAAPLTKLMRKNAKCWGPAEELAFRRLKQALTTAPILACPDFERRFVLQTDASTSGLGAVLSQHFDEGDRVIAYHRSHRTSTALHVRTRMATSSPKPIHEVGGVMPSTPRDCPGSLPPAKKAIFFRH